MTTTPAPMTAERLELYRHEWNEEFWKYAQHERGLLLFAHIDALTTRIAELEQEIEQASKLMADGKP